MSKEDTEKQKNTAGTRSPSSDLLCPECGSSDIETWEELEYENANDPTPEYGGNLKYVDFHQCKNLDCQCAFQT